MDSIYKTLLENSKQYSPDKQTEVAQMVRASQLVTAKETTAIKEAIAQGNIEQLKTLIESNTAIKQTTLWRNRAAKMAIDHGHVEILDYVLSQGSLLQNSPQRVHNGQKLPIWWQAINKNYLEMFKRLDSMGQVDWLDTIKANPQAFNWLDNSPEITQWLQKKHGIDAGLSEVLLNEVGQLDEARVKECEHLAYRLVAKLIFHSVARKDWTPLPMVLAQWRKAEITNVYPEAIDKAKKLVWRGLVNRERPDLLGKLIACDLVLRREELIGLWYEALAKGCHKSLAWLGSSATLLEEIKQQWPNSHFMFKKKIYKPNKKGYALETIKMLHEWGFDLIAHNKLGEPWLWRANLNLETIQWLAGNQPLVFESTNEQGKRMMELLKPQKKALIEKMLLKAALVSAKQPRKTKPQAKKHI